ncbi:MAG: Gfo/Idh/MocA family oxidoreductase [Candidatus Omnitrophica bacterium]|nr:Gfo/Idh/MocA family oxidoreductase [Candidatus Omnitrophota bacterium]
MKLKVLVIGAGMYVCGRGTEGFGTVLPSLYESFRGGLIESVCVAATSSTSIRIVESKNRELSKRMGFRLPLHGFSAESGEASYKEALKSFRPDCVIVAVPDHLHASVVAAVAKINAHILVVKPLAPTAKEAKSMAAAAQSHRIYGAVEFHKRFDEANLKLKEVITAGKIGDVLYINVAYSQRKMIPEKMFSSWAAQTNIFQYLGVHYVDLIYFMTGGKPLRVMATAQKNWLAKRGINTYDAVQVVIEWQDDKTKKTFMSMIATNWIDPNGSSAMSDQKISVVGTRGRVDSDQKNRGVQIVTDEHGIEDFNPYFSQLYPDATGQTVFRGYGERSFHQFFADVSNIMRGVQKPEDLKDLRPTFEQGLVSTAVIEAVGASLKKKNAWVKVDGR